MISICALRSAACPLWVISGHTDKSAPCPRKGRGVSVRFYSLTQRPAGVISAGLCPVPRPRGCNPHCHAKISSIMPGSPQGNCSKRRRACQRRKRCAGVMARLKTGGRPLLVLFGRGSVVDFTFEHSDKLFEAVVHMRRNSEDYLPALREGNECNRRRMKEGSWVVDACCSFEKKENGFCWTSRTVAPPAALHCRAKIIRDVPLLSGGGIVSQIQTCPPGVGYWR